MAILEEEIFGPLGNRHKFKDEAGPLPIPNRTAYSLAAGVWSRDIGKLQRFAKQARVGTVWMNTYGYTAGRRPWGAEGASGLGREPGTAAPAILPGPRVAWLNLAACTLPTGQPGGPPT